MENCFKISKLKKLMSLLQSYFRRSCCHTLPIKKIMLSVSKHNMMGTYGSAHAIVDKCFDYELERKKDKAKSHVKLKSHCS